MKYDVAIIGGGLAGLSLSIDLKKRGYSILVIEKGNYPRHKVCGEYISMESHAYLHSICPALSSFNLPLMNNFKLSSTWNHEFESKLDLGGFGMSRYLLEDLLFTEAKNRGVDFMLKSKVTDIVYNEMDEDYSIATTGGDVKASLACNASGRKSNLEAKETKTQLKGTNYIGIKYHVSIDRDNSFIEIHNFPGGYCGVASIEEEKTCLCYIVNSNKLNSVNNSISELEKVYLYQNKHLKKIFKNAKFIYKEPLTISGINFKIKEAVNDDSFFLGDAAGSIAPVTGNGMSIALRSAFFLASLIDSYFSNEISKNQLTENYRSFWKKEFATRVKLSRYFQKLSEYPLLTNLCIRLFNPIPSFAKRIIRQSHGESF